MNNVCKTCKGSGQEGDGAYHTCTACNGSGVSCCKPTAEDLALLAAGDFCAEELWGGSRPTCPKCIDVDFRAVAGQCSITPDDPIEVTRSQANGYFASLKIFGLEKDGYLPGAIRGLQARYDSAVAGRQSFRNALRSKRAELVKANKIIAELRSNPVPPAGDVEVLRYDMSGYGGGMIKVADGAFVYFDDHCTTVTRLTAERNGLLAEVADLQEIKDYVTQPIRDRIAARNALQSELAKAREFAVKVSNSVRHHYSHIESQIGTTLHKELYRDKLRELAALVREIDGLAHQSAPADQNCEWEGTFGPDYTGEDAPAAKGREAIDLQRDRSYRDGVMAGFGMGLNNNEESYKRVIDSLNREIHAANRSASTAKGGA